MGGLLNGLSQLLKSDGWNLADLPKGPSIQAGDEILVPEILLNRALECLHVQPIRAFS